MKTLSFDVARDKDLYLAFDVVPRDDDFYLDTLSTVEGTAAIGTFTFEISPDNEPFYRFIENLQLCTHDFEFFSGLYLSPWNRNNKSNTRSGSYVCIMNGQNVEIIPVRVALENHLAHFSVSLDDDSSFLMDALLGYEVTREASLKFINAIMTKGYHDSLNHVAAS